MAQYLLIESQCPVEPWSGSEVYTIASRLAAARHQVTLFLVQKGVLATRDAAPNIGLKRVQVIADELSLLQHGIPIRALPAGVSAGNIDVVVQLLASGARAIWH